MKSSFHINVVIFFEVLIPLVVPLLFAFIIKPDLHASAYIYFLQLFGLYFLGRIIGRNIPATCNTCSAVVKPEGTSLIVYHCKKCGFRYSKRLGSDDFHNNHD